MSQYDGASLYGFLTQTPEQALRKMLVDNKPMADVHFSLLMKIVRACNESAFVGHFEKADFPKVKMTPNEINLKDKFWNDVIAACQSRGILQPAQSKAA
ncbi:MAG TPA: hypothetical protein PLU50_08430 [Pseudobdellovibrionaceae bacterium]|nr:hypothetical protein [Pseudobdellovibrionaceae bacterium]